MSKQQNSDFFKDMNFFNKSPRFAKIISFFNLFKKILLKFAYWFWEEKRFDIREKANYSYSFLKNSIKSIIFASIIASIIYFIEPCFVQCIEKEESFTESYVTVLIAVAAIETLFIGLYYAGLTSVASVAYANVPFEIRELLIEDKVSNLFMRFASVSSIFVYIMLGMCLLFDLYSKWAFTLSIFNVTLIIPFFLYLGKRLFNLFNPRNWVSFLSTQLEHQWKILENQNYCRCFENKTEICKKQGMGIVRRFECLSQILIENTKYSKRDLYLLDCDIIRILERYQTRKRLFPTNSRWYGKKHRYKNVTEQDYMSLNYMLNFQNQLPIEGINDYWFENCMEELIFADIKNYNKDAEFTAIIPRFGTYIQTLAYNNEYNRALLIIDKLWSLKPESFSQEQWAVSFIENIFILEINLIVYLSETQDKSTLSTLLQKINIKNKETLYKAGFTPSQLKDLEGLNAKIQTELKIEGSVKTPYWYILDFLCQREAIRFNDNYRLLTKQNIDRFENRLKDPQLIPIYKAVTLKCIEEYWARIFRSEDKIDSIYNSLSTNVKDPLIAFTSLKKNEYQTEYEAHLKHLTIESSNIIPVISLKDRNEEIPDYGGILILKMFDNCIDFAIKGDCGIAEKCITNGLTSIFMRTVYAKNFDEMKEFIDYAILVSTILLICSEYHSSEKLILLITSAWDRQIKFWFENESLKALFTKGKNFIFSNIDDTQMGINSQIANEFERKTIALLEKVPYEMKYPDKSMFPEQYAVVKHKSALIRYLVKEFREQPSYIQEIDIKHPFIAYYFMKNPYLQDCNFGYENEHLRKELEGGNDEKK